jgi:hypothetical protein
MQQFHLKCYPWSKQNEIPFTREFISLVQTATEKFRKLFWSDRWTERFTNGELIAPLKNPVEK